jgi:hypothetical protein
MEMTRTNVDDFIANLFSDRPRIWPALFVLPGPTIMFQSKIVILTWVENFHSVYNKTCVRMRGLSPMSLPVMPVIDCHLKHDMPDHNVCGGSIFGLF